MQSNKNSASFYGWKNTGLLFTVYLSSLGVVFYGYSVIFPEMIKAMGWTRGEASLAQTFSLGVSGLLFPLGACMLNKFGSKKTIVTGLFILITGVFLLGTAIDELWQWTIIWGFFMPFGFVFAGLLSVQTTTMLWFNIKRATVIGIVMTGAAVGGFLVQPFYTWVMDYTQLWQSAWIVAGFIVILALILSFRIKDKPSDIGQYPDGITPDELKNMSEEDKINRTYRTSDKWKPIEIFKTPTLYFITFVSVAHMMSLMLIISHGVLHITDIGYTKMEAASVLMLIIMGSGAARIPVGWLGDRVEPRWILTVTLGIMLISFIGIWKGPSLLALMIIGPVFGVCYGAQGVMMPSLMGNYFGAENFATISGITAPFVVIFGAIIPAGSGYFADRFGNYDLVFIILSIVLGASVICGCFLYPPKKHNN